MFCLNAEDPDKNEEGSVLHVCPHWKLPVVCRRVRRTKPWFCVSFAFSVCPESLEIMSLLTQAKGKFVLLFLTEDRCDSRGQPSHRGVRSQRWTRASLMDAVTGLAAGRLQASRLLRPHREVVSARASRTEDRTGPSPRLPG